MGKKILTVFAIIAVMIYLLIPLFVASFVLMAVFISILAIFNKYPKEISRVIYYTITPLLICGWIYYGYYIYANDYCNTYNIYLDDKKCTVITRNEKDVYIKAWNFFLAEKKNNVSSSDYSYYSNVLVIENLSRPYIYNHQMYSSELDSFINANKLYYYEGKNKVKISDIISWR